MDTIERIHAAAQGVFASAEAINLATVHTADKQKADSLTDRLRGPLHFAMKARVVTSPGGLGRAPATRMAQEEVCCGTSTSHPRPPGFVRVRQGA